MQIALALSFAELDHRLRFARDPLSILSIVNLVGPGNWNVGITFDATGENILSIDLPEGVDPFRLVSIGPVDLFENRKLEVRSAGQTYSCDWREQQSNDPKSNILLFDSMQNAQSSNGIVLRGFKAKTLPAEFADSRAVRRFLDVRTWFGSKSVMQGRYCLRLSVGAHTVEFGNRSSINQSISDKVAFDAPRVALSMMLGQPPLGELMFSGGWGFESKQFRWGWSGAISNEELTSYLGSDAARLLREGEIEVTFPERSFAPDGSLALDEKCRRLLAEVVRALESLPAHPKIREYEQAGNLYDRQLSARRIDSRKQELLKTGFVYFRDKLVYREPSNENELVAFHQKLEGIGGVPTAEFVSLEYTPKLGIDAIANIKVETTEPLHRLATIEFEYNLANFFLHRHPVEQTDFIICWKAADALPEYDFQPDSVRPWLSYLRIGGKLIRVLCASKYPALHVRQMGS